MKSIGEKIKFYRKRLAMTQTALGEKIGVQRSTVQKYESGQIASFNAETIRKIADALGVSIAVLVGDTVSTKTEYELLYRHFGASGVQILDLLLQMNDEGRMKVVVYANDIKASYPRDEDE